MERGTTVEDALSIMGVNFFGPVQLSGIADHTGIRNPTGLSLVVPPIPFKSEDLEKWKNDYILILGIPDFSDGTPLNICNLRSFHGIDPSRKEPCFYNQDWYLNEKFANECRLENKWYLLRKRVMDSSRGPNSLRFKFSGSGTHGFPTALLAVYTFFVYYYSSEEILWPNDYLWCSDLDHNNDRIYVGRYYDPEGINKNGFSIHRHLAIRENYGIADAFWEHP